VANQKEVHPHYYFNFPPTIIFVRLLNSDNLDVGQG